MFISSFIALLSAFGFIACGGSDNDEEDIIPPVETYSPVGVWESGNFFLSLSADKFCTAYVADKFIDCGNYTVTSGNNLSCRNTYFSRNTSYTIKNLTNSKIEVDVTYTDIEGATKNKTLILTKSDKIPATKDNPLVGKTCVLGFSQNISAKVYYSFATFQTASKTTTQQNAAKWPMTLFYIFFDGKLYFQQFNQSTGQVPQIGGWNVDAGTGDITVWTINTNPDGSIEFDNKISDIAL